MNETPSIIPAIEDGVGGGPETFEEFDLYPEVAEAIAKLGFEAPTPVQSRTFADVMGGGDVVVMAQTGTGKTAAFGIPLAQKLDPKGKRVQALVLTPTRELALQVAREVTAIGKGRGFSAAAVYGGASFTKQVEEIKHGAQIVAGTPGRVLDHMRRRTIRFDGIQVLVLDEADEMLSMGFEKELSEIIEGLPKKRQNMLFSATIPDDIQRLAGRYMSEATRISVSGDAVAAAEISHYVYLVSGLGRVKDLVRVLEVERPDSAIIFCNTRDETQAVARFLKESGYNADWINSDLSQAERERVMQATRKGKLKFMVATDVAARGIDISHLSHVINYSFPESLEVYVHRTGRTGRLGRHGAAVSLITPQDIGNLYFLRLTYKIFPVEKMLPDSEQDAKTMELKRLEVLRAAVLGQPDGEFTGLARRVLQDMHAEEIVAGLLKGHFDKPDEPVQAAPPPPEPVREPEKKPEPEKKAEPKPKVPPKPKAKAEKKAEPKKKVPPKPKAKAEKKAEPKKKPAPKKEKADEPEEEAAREIYVDAGRKDGLRISTLMKDIVERTGLARSALGRVRMLTRSTFIAVPEKHFKKVLAAVKKVEVDGRKLKAEPAEES